MAMGKGRTRVRRSNWSLRVVAAILSALAFVGFWQAASGAPRATSTATPTATPTPGDFSLPTPDAGAVRLPGSFGSPHGGTHLS
jgi:hypothetical protein